MAAIIIMIAVIVVIIIMLMIAVIVIIIIMMIAVIVIMIAVVQTKQQLDTKRHFHCFSPELNPLSLPSCCHSCSNEKILFFQHYCGNSMQHLADRTRDLHHITLSKKYDAAPPLAFHSDWFEHIYHQHLLTIIDLSLMSQGFFYSCLCCGVGVHGLHSLHA